MKQIHSSEIIKDSLIQDAIINDCHDGFIKDYLVLHCLLKQYSQDIKRFLEIGTNRGLGTKIIKNALGPNSEVYTLDLPFELSHISQDYPLFSGKDHMAHLCDLPFIQIRSDSTKYNYKNIYPIDGWFIDGKHNYDNPFFESKQAIKANSKLIIWHDVDIVDIYNAINDAFKNNNSYSLFRVIDTRIAYAVRKNNI